MKPILFNTEMVQAILEGRKTQTRRVVKGEASKWLNDGFLPSYVADPENTYFHQYGKPGELLWVRETFRKYFYVDKNGYTHFDRELVEFAADNPPMINEVDGDGFHVQNKDGTEKFIPWKPSIHMPREACRLFLKVKNVRIERLQDCSEEDAISEGLTRLGQGEAYRDWFYSENTYFTDSATLAFQKLWQKINGEKSWELNPWVWVIEFERTEKPEQ